MANVLENAVSRMVDDYVDEQLDIYKQQGKELADKAIKSVGKRVQKEFIDKIEDKAFKKAASSTLKKFSSVDNILGAFKSIKDDVEMLQNASQDVQVIAGYFQDFLEGKIDRVQMMEMAVDKADEYISNLVGSIATKMAVEFGPLAPEVGAFASEVASKMFREACLPVIQAAKRAKVARENYELLHGIYEEAIVQKQHQREIFINKMTAKFQANEKLINESLDELDRALSVNDVNKISSTLNNLAKDIGGRELPIKSREAFDDIILNKKGKLKIG